MHSIVLTDVATNVWIDELEVNSRNVPGIVAVDNWSIRKFTLRGGASHGIDVVSIDNGVLRFDVLPTRGMGLWRGDCYGITLGWNSPVTYPVHPAFVNVTAANGLGWLRGFSEWVCRCGLASLGPPGIDVREVDGVVAAETPLTLHGAIANTPAHHVEVHVSEEAEGTLGVTGIVDEATMFGPALRLVSQLRTHIGSTSLEIVDEITNFGDTSAEVQLMYHANFGPPLLEPGARVVTAARQVVPGDDQAIAGIAAWDSYAAPTPGIAQEVFLIEPLADSEGVASVMLRNAAGDRGASISFPVAELPCLTVWKYPGGIHDGYVTGLEPSTSYPNLKSFERQRGRVVRLKPGATYRASIQILIHPARSSVESMEARIEGIQGGQPAPLHAGFHPDFNPQAR